MAGSLYNVAENNTRIGLSCPSEKFIQKPKKKKNECVKILGQN